MSNVYIDLRPHYIFAYSSDSMEFGSRQLLFYNKKDKSLHYKKEPGMFEVDSEEAKEFTLPISDEKADVIKEMFRLMIETFNSYPGEPWFVLDGSECVVICGKKRIRFQGPCFDEPFGSFYNAANHLCQAVEGTGEESFEDVMSEVKEASRVLQEHLSEYTKNE